MAWTEQCKIDFGKQVEHLVSQGASKRKAIRKLSEESDIPESTLDQWVWPRGKNAVKNNGTKGLPSGGERWPHCSICGVNSVSPRGKGVCRRCTKRKREQEWSKTRKKKIEEGRKKFEQTPIDPEIDRCCREFAEELIQTVEESKEKVLGKVSLETHDLLSKAHTSVRDIYYSVLHKSEFILS